MEIYIKQQLQLFASSVLLGFCIALFYDIFRAFRLRFPALAPILDILYCGGSFGGIFLFVLQLAGGELRFFILFGGIGGCILFFSLFSKLLRPIWEFWVNVLVDFFAVLFFPLKQLKKFFLKIMKNAKNLFLFWGKWGKIVNYKWAVIRIHRKRGVSGMKKAKKEQKKRPKASFFTKILILVLILGLGYQLLSLRRQVAGAEETQAKLSAQVDALSQENEALTQDIENGDNPELMEKIAREKLGLVNPGEKVFYDVIS